MKTVIFIIFILVVARSGSCLADQDVSDKVNVTQEFKSLDMDMNLARTNQVDILSPSNFKVANKYFEDAKKSLDKQKDLKQEILHQITMARDYLNNAKQVARLSHQHIKDVVIARQQAVAAGAPIYFVYDFQKADELLQKVTSDLEYNSAQNAEANRAALQATYSDLELRAIKHQNLAQARLTLIQAIKDGAKKYVPEKLKVAIKNYKDADAYITKHRHDIEQIQTRSFAVNQSANELLQITHDLAEAKKMSSDELMALSGSEDQVKIQQSAVSTDQKTIQSLEAKIKALESEKTINDKLEQARSKFTPDEAEVYKQGNTLVIRLRGLKFPVSEAVLSDSNLRLLGKVQRTVKEFGNSSVVIEGHTDSSGSETLNEKLSKARAQTIKDYLLSIDAMPSYKIKTVGAGDQKPLATNKTPEGRAQNRRVDVLIQL